MPTITVTQVIQLTSQQRGRKAITRAEGETPVLLPPGRVPRLARWMALALLLQQNLESSLGVSKTELARRGRVSKARISQLMTLVHLAPDLQAALLELPRVVRGREPILLQHVLPIAREPDWQRQRTAWKALQRDRLPIATA
jgi:hypothetical protein